jgi:hypothetical protein
MNSTILLPDHHRHPHLLEAARYLLPRKITDNAGDEKSPGLPKERTMKKRIPVNLGLVLMAVSVFVPIALFAGCASPKTTELDYLFERQYLLGESHMIGFSGNAAGHVSGETSEFQIYADEYSIS